MKLQGGEGMGIEFAALATGVVGVPDDAAGIEALDQHDPCGWPAVGADRGDRHGIGLRQLLGQGFVEPATELGQRVGGHVVHVEAATFVGFAQVGELGGVAHGRLSGSLRCQRV
jgi:hypothetical protein